MRVRDIPARMEMSEEAGELVARVRPAGRLRILLLAVGIGLLAVSYPLSHRFHVPPWLDLSMLLVMTFGIAVMIRRLFYYLGATVEIRAGGDGLRLRYPGTPIRKNLTGCELSAVRLTEEEDSPLAGINMGPLGGSLWCEADGRYVSFGRGLSEADARTLADRINAIIGKPGTGKSSE